MYHKFLNDMELNCGLREERPAIKRLNRWHSLTFAVYRTKMHVFSSSKEQLRCYLWIPTS